MCVSRGQNPAPQSLENRMRHDTLHQPLTQAASAVRFQHEHIAQISDGSEIADHAGKSNLRAVSIINSKTERVLNRPSDNLFRNSLRPITICEEIVNYIQVQPRMIGADQKITAPIFSDFTHRSLFFDLPPSRLIPSQHSNSRLATGPTASPPFPYKAGRMHRNPNPGKPAHLPRRARPA